jgi:hypothetical protein
VSKLDLRLDLLVRMVDPVSGGSSLIVTRLVTIGLDWTRIRVSRGSHAMIVAAIRAFTTLPLRHRTYLNNPRSVLGPVNFHGLILNLHQLTDWLQTLGARGHLPSDYIVITL